MFHPNHSRGQGIAEYSLAGVLLALLSVPGIYLLSQGFNGNLLGMADVLPDQPGNNGASGIGLSHVTGSSALATNGSVHFAPGTSLSFTTSKGNRIQLDNIQTDSLSHAVYTTGTNEVTRLLSDTLTQLGKEMLASGEITQKQANSLNTLANQGHEIARIEALIETAARQPHSGSPEEQAQHFLSQKVDYNGQQLTVQDLMNQIGYAQPPHQGNDQKYNDSVGYEYTGTPSAPLNPYNTPYPATRAFIQAYKKLEKSGALSNPQVNEIVTNLSKQIAVMSASANQATGAIIMGNGSTADIRTLEASVVSQSKSTKLCDTGGVQDNGIHCGS